MTKIDIFIPYWGDFGLLKEAVDSVLCQTSKAWELTILDDCYPSSQAKDYYQKLKDTRIKYIRHKKNIGVTNNFNYAIKSAKQTYVTIMGCDDKLLPDYVETALKNIGDADFYQPGVEVIDRKSRVYSPLTDRVKRLLRPNRKGLYSGEKLAVSLCRGNWLYFPSIVWKTNTLKKYPFNPKYKIVEDVEVELNMIIDGAKLYVDKDVTFQYRRFAESLSSKEKAKNGIRFKEEEELYGMFASEFRSLGWNKAGQAARRMLLSKANKALSKFL